MAQLINIRLHKPDHQPLGFRLQGGKDFGTPLVIQKVNGGSAAEAAGLRAGDALIRVNNTDVYNLRHQDAQDTIRAAGQNLDITVQRGGGTWRPSVTPVGSLPRPNKLGAVSPVTKTSLKASPQPSQAFGSGHNSVAKPFGYVNGSGDSSVKSIVNKQYNTPVGMYSDQTIAETLSAQTEVLAGGVLGVNFKKNEKTYDAEKSAVFKMLQEDANEPEPEAIQSPIAPPISGLRHVPAPVTKPDAPINNTGGLPPGQNICEECERLIIGVFVRIKDKNLHVECFKCATCGTSLKNQGYYNLNGKLYCDIHAKMVARQNPPAANLEPVTVPPGGKFPSGTYSAPLSSHTTPLPPLTTNHYSNGSSSLFSPASNASGPKPFGSSGSAYSPSLSPRSAPLSPATRPLPVAQPAYQPAQPAYQPAYQPAQTAYQPAPAPNSETPSYYVKPEYKSAAEERLIKKMAKMALNGYEIGVQRKIKPGDHLQSVANQIQDTIVTKHPLNKTNVPDEEITQKPSLRNESFSLDKSNSDNVAKVSSYSPAYKNVNDYDKKIKPNEVILNIGDKIKDNVVNKHPSKQYCTPVESHTEQKKLSAIGNKILDAVPNQDDSNLTENAPNYPPPPPPPAHTKVEKDSSLADPELQKYLQDDEMRTQFLNTVLCDVTDNGLIGHNGVKTEVLKPIQKGLDQNKNSPKPDRWTANRTNKTKDIVETSNINAYNTTNESLKNQTRNFENYSNRAITGNRFDKYGTFEEKSADYSNGARKVNNFDKHGTLKFPENDKDYSNSFSHTLKSRKHEKYGTNIADKTNENCTGTLKANKLNQYGTVKSEENSNNYSNGNFKANKFGKTDTLKPDEKNNDIITQSRYSPPTKDVEPLYDNSFYSPRKIITNGTNGYNRNGSYPSSNASTKSDDDRSSSSGKENSHYETENTGFTDSIVKMRKKTRDASIEGWKRDSHIIARPKSIVDFNDGTYPTDDKPIIRVCHVDEKQITRGPFITALGRIWCPDHFICVNASCRRPLQDIGFVEENGQLYCEYCFEQFIAPACDKCHAKIKGDCLNAIGKHFHPECFNCVYCGKLFGNNPFFLEDGQPYCEADWNELFTTKCFACGFPVEAGDRWVEALNNNYHSQCFNCTMCKKNLEGQSFFAKGGRPFCKNHAR